MLFRDGQPIGILLSVFLNPNSLWSRSLIPADTWSQLEFIPGSDKMHRLLAETHKYSRQAFFRPEGNGRCHSVTTEQRFMKEENPFRAPVAEHEPAAPRGSERDFLIRIARAQRHVLFVMLGYCFLFPLQFIPQFVGTGQTFFYCACVIVVLLGAVTTYRLSSMFNTKRVALLHTIGLIVPFLGLFFLYLNSSQATSVLRARGIRTGLFGANPNSI